MGGVCNKFYLAVVMNNTNKLESRKSDWPIVQLGHCLMLKRARDRETRMEEARVIGQLLHCEGLTDVRVDEKR